MPSPSVALLAALITGKGRPKRLLLQENAPAFVSNLGLIVGATVAKVLPQDIDEVLAGLLRTEGLRAEQVWAVATHRAGTLSPTDWLSRCVANGIPTVELCLGSLFALVRWSPFPAAFTIVDLDAEEAFAGAGLAALLTSDRALFARIRELCLPASGTQDYIFDAMPRALAHDEAALADLVERVIALDGEKPPSALRFQPAASTEGLKKIEELQRTVDRWEALFQEAETEAARDAEILSRARADLLKYKTESGLALASAQAEREALAQKLVRAERERDLAVAAAGRHDESERGSLSALQERVAQFEKAAAAAAEREARLSATEEASRVALNARISQLETDAAGAGRARAELLQQKAEAVQALASAQAEKKALALKLADLEAELAEARKGAETRAAEHRAALDEHAQRTARLEKDVATLTAREAARLREWGGAKDGLSERITALEAERDTLGNKLAAIEKDRDRALSEASRREETQRREAAENRQRADRLEAEAAALKEREAKLTEGFSASRAGLSEEMSRLESEAALARKASAALQAERAADVQALAQARAELKAVSEKLAEAERTHARVMADAERSREALRAELAAHKEDFEKAGASETGKARTWEAERAQMSERIARLEASAAETQKSQAALEAEKLRAAQLEKELAARIERETRLTDEGMRLRADLSERVVQLEAAATAAEKARADLVTKIAAMEQDHATALREATRGDDAQRQAFEAEKRRAVQLAGDVSNLRERDARLTQEWEAARAEWTERVRRAEDAALVARNANAGLVARKNEAEQARASLQADLEEQMRLAQALKMEAAATAAREAKKVEAAEASRAELEARIAKLEAGAVIADKARTELLNRKRETERALAEAQAERAALVKKLAIAENERDQARAALARPGVDPQARPVAAAPPAAGAPAAERNTGGLSALVGLWNTAVIRRPARIQEPAETAPDPSADEILPAEALLGNAPPTPASAPVPTPEGTARPGSDRPAQGAASPATHRTTGGLSALVNLWNTAATMRPFRRKEAEAKSSDPVDPVLGIEEIPDEAPSSSDPAPIQGAPARPRPERPAPGARARPNPTPRRPEPKPAPAPDETEKLGGWLRGLAGRVRGKPK